MNKKAFVLMETIVVIVVISVALLTIFASYNKILVKVKKENKYDTSEYIYMTNYIKKYLSSKSPTFFDFSTTDLDTKPINYFSNDYSSYAYYTNNPFKIKRIYLLTNIGHTNTENNFKKFDAYMIDYIRKLDVGISDKIIVVEYYRYALDDKGNEIYSTKDPSTPLTETYIASLEW